MNLELFSPAKINLGLIIKGRRADGYHFLETLIIPVELSDQMVFESSASGFEIEISGIKEQIAPEDNLCHKAWSLLRADFPQVDGVFLRLRKNIPTGSGLGGGSSNAANTLLALDKMFDLNLGQGGLRSYAMKLGADVPFFLYGKTMFSSGIGQDLEPFELNHSFDTRIELSEIHSSTAEAYSALNLASCDPSRSLKQILYSDPREWKELLINDLEEPVFKKYPELKQIKENFYRTGAIYSAMSGSGSSVYGLYDRS